MFYSLLLLLLVCFSSCQRSDVMGLSDPDFPKSSQTLPSVFFRMSDHQKLAMEKSRSLDDWFGVEHLTSKGWKYSELRNQGHKVREDLKLSYKWRNELESLEPSKVNLSGQSRDITLLRYSLATFIFERAGFKMPRLSVLNLFINNVWQGPYLNLELVNGDFLRSNSMPEGALFKAQYRAELTLKNDVKMSQAFAQKYPDPVESDLQSLVRLEELASILDGGIVDDTLELSRVFDIENAICYLAVSKLIQNDDGVKNNYYLYLNSQTDKFEFIPWDLDETFRGADVEGVYVNNFFEQLESREDFRSRIFKKMHEIWDEAIIAGELETLNDSIGPYAGAQKRYYLNPQLEHENNIQSIRKFIQNVTIGLSESKSFVKK